MKQLSANGDTYLTVNSPGVGGLRAGVADNAVRFYVYTGGWTANSTCSGPTVTFPLSGSVHLTSCYGARATTGAGSSNNVHGNPWPQTDAIPFYFRIVRRSGTMNTFLSSDGVTWTAGAPCTGATTLSAVCSWGTTYGAASLDHVEIPLTAISVAQGNTGWIEIDQFTLTVN